eukprot:TRINITY_DN27616_c0_g1_i3.p1 TRINITY_DN27616_c0_g1~~TRINITY_DN27616_c0_g1_i3.p1  ORF type:complete len:1236 (-),score=149.79 TRINITY_DN27616_c0_g1_i3:331-4038(-)
MTSSAEAEEGARVKSKSSVRFSAESQVSRRHVRRISTKRGSIKPFLEDPSACSGIVSDYLARRRGAAELPADVRRNAHGLQILEQLQADLLRNIILQFKTNEHPGWPSVGIAALRAHAKVLFEHRRTLQSTGCRLRKRLFRAALSKPTKPPPSETNIERRERLVEFWTTFHDRFWDEPSPTLAALTPHVASPHNVLASPTSLPLLCSRSPTPSWQTTSRPSSQQALKRPASQPSLHSSARLGGSSVTSRRRGSRTSSNQGGTTRPPTSPVLGMDAPGLGTLAASMTLCRAGRNNRNGATKKTVAGLLGKDGVGEDLFHATTPRSFISRRRQYIRDCSNGGVVPTTLRYLTGHSTELTAAGRDLRDPDLLAVVATLRERGCVQDVDLSDNSLLTDVSLVPFLEGLAEFTADNIRTLTLRNCLQLGPGATHAALSLIKDASGLQMLDLSRVPIGLSMHLPLCDAIGRHCTLDKVNLAGTGLGTCLASQCVAALLGSFKIVCLDLGWNCFSADVFACFGECLKLNSVLKDLRICNCSCLTPQGDTSCAYLLELLGYNKSLTHLDISMNRVDLTNALVLEDSLERHKLERVDVSQNPLGVLGMRSMLRLLVRDSSGLDSFRSDNCSGYGGGTEVAIMHEEEQSLSLALPGRRYCLDLSRPPHRSILRMLYKIAERFGMKGEDVFLNVAYRDVEASNTVYKHGARDAQGVVQVLSRGSFQATFSLGKVLDGRFSEKLPEYNVFLREELQRRRCDVANRKIVPLLAKWKQLEGQSIQQEIFVKALARDFNFPLDLLGTFVNSTERAFVAQALTTLLPCTDLTPSVMYISYLMFPKVSDLVHARRKMVHLLDFNAQNPTGHYRLDLANSDDYVVAERIILMDRWETVIDRKRGVQDTSPNGNGAHTRNEIHHSKPLLYYYNTLSDWCPPESGVFELDYVGSERPPEKAVLMCDRRFPKLLASVYDSQCVPAHKIRAVRSISHHVYFTSLQMRMLMSLFRTDDAIEVFVICFTRIADWWNEKVCRIRFNDELPRLRQRLGYCNMFPFIQPENTRFEFDLSRQDQRYCASFVVFLCNREKPCNIVQPTFQRTDGKFEAFTAGVPRSWEDHAKLPQSGFFRGFYVCSPESRQFALRKKAAELYTKFQIHAEESAVSWWTGKCDVPDDVMGLLEFIARIFPNVEKAFNLIDGPGGNQIHAWSGTYSANSGPSVTCAYTSLLSFWQETSILTWIAFGMQWTLTRAAV